MTRMIALSVIAQAFIFAFARTAEAMAVGNMLDPLHFGRITVADVDLWLKFVGATRPTGPLLDLWLLRRRLSSRREADAELRANSAEQRWLEASERLATILGISGEELRAIPIDRLQHMTQEELSTKRALAFLHSEKVEAPS